MNLSNSALELFSRLLGSEFEYLCQHCTDSDEDKAQQEQVLDELFALLSTLRNNS